MTFGRVFFLVSTKSCRGITILLDLICPAQPCKNFELHRPSMLLLTTVVSKAAAYKCQTKVTTHNNIMGTVGTNYESCTSMNQYDMIVLVYDLVIILISYILL